MHTKTYRQLHLFLGSNQWTTISFIYDPITHQTHIIEVARDILDDLNVVVRPVLSLMIKRFDRNAVLVLEQRIEQRSVRVAARVPHDVDLERCGVDEGKQFAVIVRFQITDRFDVFQIVVVVQLGNLFVIVVQLVPIAEDDRVLVVAQFTVNMVDLEIRTFGYIKIGRTRVVEVQKQNLVGKKVNRRNVTLFS